MTWAEIKKKYREFENPSFTRGQMSTERERDFVNDCFDAYELGGFANRFFLVWSEKEYAGMKFEVIERVSEYTEENTSGADLEYLPMWKIRFENGDIIHAFPEEICLDEINGNNVWIK